MWTRHGIMLTNMEEKQNHGDGAQPSQILSSVSEMMNRKSRDSDEGTVMKEKSRRSSKSGINPTASQAQKKFTPSAASKGAESTPGAEKQAEQRKLPRKSTKLGVARGGGRIEKTKARKSAAKGTVPQSRKTNTKGAGPSKQAQDDIEVQGDKEAKVYDEEWYRNAYKRFGEGPVTFAEFAGVINSIGQATVSHATLSMLFNKVAHDGKIDFAEFMSLMAKADSFERRQKRRSQRMRRSKRS